MMYFRLLSGVIFVALALPAAAVEPVAPPDSLRIHMIGVGEYKPVDSLTELKNHLEMRYRVEITTSFSLEAAQIYKGNKSLPNMDSLKQADVMVIFARRMKLPEEQMAIIRNHWEQGKAIVAMRTSSHAFQPDDNAIFDQQVLGGHYSGAADYTTPFQAIPAEGQAEHPVLAGVQPITSKGYYGNRPLAQDSIVLQVNDEPQRKAKRPVTWLHTYKGGRTFYTSMGVPEDFRNDDFLRLLTNAIFWTAKREPERMKLVREWPQYKGDAGRTGVSLDDSLKPPLKLRWSYRLDGDASGDAGAGVIVGGRLVFVNVANTRSIVALDADTGAYCWKYDESAVNYMTVPSYSSGRLFLWERQAKRARVLALDSATEPWPGIGIGSIPAARTGWWSWIRRPASGCGSAARRTATEGWLSPTARCSSPACRVSTAPQAQP